MYYNQGETVILRLDIYSRQNALADPNTPPVVTVTNPNGTVITTAQAMTREATGKWFYYQVTSNAFPYGRYKVAYTVTDISLITKHNDFFDLGR